MKETLETDVLIIGSGIAGGTAALELARLGVRCLVISKGADKSATNTWLAQGGIAALSEDESVEEFMRDIIRSGDGINHTAAVNQVVSLSRRLVERFLIQKLGVPFSTRDGKFDLAREGAHSRRRVLNVKDMTGRVIQQHLDQALRDEAHVTMLYRHQAIDLLTCPHHSTNPLRQYEEPRVVGAYVLNLDSGRVWRVFARHVILATGGLSSIFLHSTNPSSAVGNGIAMAQRAGARLANLEYVQFHPTSLYQKGSEQPFLISEAVRGEGAKLVNRKGEYFMTRYSDQADLAPRDEVSRAIYEEMIRNGDDYVMLDLASFTKISIEERFPTITEHCRGLGMDITARPIPVVPAAHYSCGGVLVDLNGRSSLKGLYAVGEVSCTGVHGANRLASVSLLEGMVWGSRAAEDIAAGSDDPWQALIMDEIPSWRYPPQEEEPDPALIWQDMVTVRYTMWNYAGIIRTNRRLDRARSDLDYLRHRVLKFYQKVAVNAAIIDLRDSVQTSLLVVEAARHNQVSRGAHFMAPNP
ncbi:MAG: L-aspartate oxidase [Acidobacteriota bacterium]|jgi:L-aspartate oxidase|nr:L-aspartate oxidase [Acidobacteriota bacterium]